MAARYLGDDSPPKGYPIDMECPKCGGVVYAKPVPRYLGSPDGELLRCSECDWMGQRDSAAEEGGGE